MQEKQKLPGLVTYLKRLFVEQSSQAMLNQITDRLRQNNQNNLGVKFLYQLNELFFGNRFTAEIPLIAFTLNGV